MAVGVVCTTIHYAVLGLGVEWLGIGAVAASSTGFAIGTGVNYVLNRRFTFRTDASHAAVLWKFLLVLGTGFLLNMGCMEWLYGRLQWHYILSQLITTGITMTWGFVANRHWTFRAARPVKTGSR